MLELQVQVLLIFKIKSSSTHRWQRGFEAEHWPILNKKTLLGFIFSKRQLRDCEWWKSSCRLHNVPFALICFFSFCSCLLA